MAIVLYRIDERLIHGQVVLGWGDRLHPHRYVVVDDELAASEWEQELYLLGLPEDVETLFVTVEEAREKLDELREYDDPTVLLTRDPESMERLARGGLMAQDAVNIGGIHHHPGRVQVLGYVYLDDSDRTVLTALADQVESVSARDLPASAKVPLDQLLR